MTTEVATRHVLLGAVRHLRGTQIAAELNVLRTTYSWAVLHSPDTLPAPQNALEVRRRRLNDEHGVELGGEGTPEVMAYTPVELAAVLHLSLSSTRSLLADALDLPHRLPRCWTRLEEGDTDVWHGRAIARKTRHLSREQARAVDASVAAYLGRVPFPRLERIVDAAIAVADPAGTRSKELEAASRRFVAIGRGNDHHLRSLVARVDSLDALMLMAMVNRVADLLAVEGDTDDVDLRRSRALGLLARPDDVLALLLRHTGSDQAPSVPAPDDEAPDDEAPDDEAPDDEAPDVPSRFEQLLADPAAASAVVARTKLPSPRVVLHLHLTDQALTGLDPKGVARVEGLGPVTASTVRLWLTEHLKRHDLGVTVRSVAVPGDAVPADSYEIPDRLREAVRLRHPIEIYPYGHAESRNLDLDHTEPYVPPDDGGPPGQTSTANLGPLGRSHHRAKTQRRMNVRQPAPGVLLWRSEHGYVFLVTNTATHDLGDGDFAQGLWRAADLGAGTRVASAA